MGQEERNHDEEYAKKSIEELIRIKQIDFEKLIKEDPDFIAAIIDHLNKGQPGTKAKKVTKNPKNKNLRHSLLIGENNSGYIITELVLGEGASSKVKMGIPVHLEKTEKGQILVVDNDREKLVAIGTARYDQEFFDKNRYNQRLELNPYAIEKKGIQRSKKIKDKDYTVTYRIEPLARGETLHSHLERRINEGNLTRTELLDLYVETLTAIQTQCHDKKLLHRDIKTHNILYNPNGKADHRCTVIDWDDAVAFEDPEKGITDENETLKGTLTLIAPEVCRMSIEQQRNLSTEDNENIKNLSLTDNYTYTVRSDIFAVGMMLKLMNDSANAYFRDKEPPNSELERVVNRFQIEIDTIISQLSDSVALQRPKDLLHAIASLKNYRDVLQACGKLIADFTEFANNKSVNDELAKKFSKLSEEILHIVDLTTGSRQDFETIKRLQGKLEAIKVEDAEISAENRTAQLSFLQTYRDQIKKNNSSFKKPKANNRRKPSSRSNKKFKF